MIEETTLTNSARGALSEFGKGGLAMKIKTVDSQEDQVNEKTTVKEAYKKPALTKHESLRDITGQVYEIPPPTN